MLVNLHILFLLFVDKYLLGIPNLFWRALPMLSLYNFTLPVPLPNLRLIQFTLSDIKYDVIITTHVLASSLIDWQHKATISNNISFFFLSINNYTFLCTYWPRFFISLLRIIDNWEKQCPEALLCLLHLLVILHFGPYIHSDDCFKVASFRVISEKLGFYQPVSKLLLKKFNFIIFVLVHLSFDCLVSKDYHSEL